MAYWFWSIIALVIGLPLLLRTIAWLSVMGIRLKPARWTPSSEKISVPWESQLFSGAQPLLEAQGFVFEGLAHYRDDVVGEPDLSTFAFHRHPESGAWAWVGLAEAPTPTCPFTITYITCHSDGSLLVTRNMSSELGFQLLPFWHEQTLWLDSWEAVWKAHQRDQILFGKHGVVEQVSFTALIFLLNHSESSRLESMRAKGYISESAPENYRLTQKGGWWALKKIEQIRMPMRRAKIAWNKKSTRYPLPPEAEAHAHFRLRRVKAKAGMVAQGVFILISFLAFGFLFGNGFDPITAITIIGILGLHELGHAAMMAIFGYRNDSIFFIPFFGALVNGTRTSSLAPWKEACVLLAGPLPGLMLGAFLFITPIWQGTWQSQLGLLAMALNGLNLLPVTPFDGGKLVDLIFFRKAPKAGLGFLVLSGLGLIGMGLGLSDPILGFLGIAILLNSPNTYRNNVVLKSWRNKNPAFNQKDLEVITGLFTNWNSPKLLPFATKSAAIHRMRQAANGRAPGNLLAGTLFMVYLAAWSAPLFIMGSSIMWRASRDLPVKMVKRENLPRQEKKVFDTLCKSPGVVTLTTRQSKDSTVFLATVIRVQDSGMVRAVFTEAIQDASPARPLFLQLMAPIWGLGELDSSVTKGAIHSSIGGDFVFPDEADTLPPEALIKSMQVYKKKVDSLRRDEDSIWNSWSDTKRKGWLKGWKISAKQRGETSNCLDIRGKRKTVK